MRITASPLDKAISTYPQIDFTVSTYDSEHYVAQFNAELKRMSSHADNGREDMLKALAEWSTILAAKNVEQGNGGPFGGLIVDTHTADGVPVVIGVGTNHVGPSDKSKPKDPSAHAEMTAIRDAVARTGKSDLSGKTLITSCECCPMCLALATSCNLREIYFSATRFEAAKVDFSDEDQYRLLRDERGAAAYSSLVVDASDKQRYEHLLTDEHGKAHDAVVVVNSNGTQKRYFGDNKSAAGGDPSQLASVQAIRNACAGEKHFHLPEDTQLISRHALHPMAQVVADWARIGRVRGTDPGNPAQDKQDKDPSRIVYLDETLERMVLQSDHGMIDALPADLLLKEINDRLADRRLATGRIPVPTIMNQPFDKWREFISGGERARY